MRLLRKDTADSYLKGDFVYYWENGELKRSKYIVVTEQDYCPFCGARMDGGDD